MRVEQFLDARGALGPPLVEGAQAGGEDGDVLDEPRRDPASSLAARADD